MIIIITNLYYKSYFYIVYPFWLTCLNWDSLTNRAVALEVSGHNRGIVVLSTPQALNQAVCAHWSAAVHRSVFMLSLCDVKHSTNARSPVYSRRILAAVHCCWHNGWGTGNWRERGRGRDMFEFVSASKWNLLNMTNLALISQKWQFKPQIYYVTLQLSTVSLFIGVHRWI